MPRGEDTFESINLAPTTFSNRPLLSSAQLLESSDDGLDPEDFLTTSHSRQGDEDEESQADNTQSIEREETLSPPNIDGRISKPPSSSGGTPASFRPLDSINDSIIASIDPESFSWRMPSLNRENFEDSPLGFLTTNQPALKATLRRHINAHKQFLEQGDDCSDIRILLMEDLQKISKNYFLLGELYSSELKLMEGLLSNFESWDKKRSKVLHRIKSIKSENHRYGSKLALLLNKRSELDQEIDTLESRLQKLKTNRTLINKEVEEASSVLESKSAKYVNIFRDLERQGFSVISDFLHYDGLPEKDHKVLLQSEPVDAGFSYQELGSSKHTPPPQIQQAAQTVEAVPQRHETMGMQPLVIPEEQNQRPEHQTDSPYDRGYDKGAQQLQSVKQGLANFMNAVFNPPPPRSKPQPQKVDDISNTITEKIDFQPISNFLASKIEALHDMSIKASTSSVAYHEQAEKWASVLQFLGAKESELMSVISGKNHFEELIEKHLTTCLDVIRPHLKGEQSETTRDKNYLRIILQHEAKALAETLSRFSNNVEDFSSLETSMLDTTVLEEPRSKSDIHMKMTSAGYQPSTSATATVAAENANPTILGQRKSPYQYILKNLKKE